MTFYSSPESSAFATVACRAPETPRHGPNGGAVVLAATLTVPVPPSANEWHRHVGRRVLLSAAARKYIKALPNHVPDAVRVPDPRRNPLVSRPQGR